MKRTKKVQSKLHAKAPSNRICDEIETLTFFIEMSTLHDTAALGDVALAQTLIAAGANVNATDDDEGATPLHLAIENGHDAVAAILLAAGADPNEGDCHDWVPLHLSKTRAQVRMLVDAGACLDMEDCCGHVPLYYAQSADHALAMIEASADITAEAWEESEYVRKAYALYLCGDQQRRFNVPVAPGKPRRRA